MTSPHQRWVESQPAPVAAILTLAEIDAPERRIIAAGLLGPHALDIEWIADRLTWVGRFESEDAPTVLGDWYEHPVSVCSLDACEALADECRDAALLTAQLIASVLPTAVAA